LERLGAVGQGSHDCGAAPRRLSRLQAGAISVAFSGALTATMPHLQHALPTLPLALPQGQILVDVLGYSVKYFNLFST